MTIAPEGSARLRAVLGPTNTGKTHLAVERMLAHRTGMMGFPLRLLAREVYDRVARAKGADKVALITGEEKIVPPEARYFLCTVESMPLDLGVEFLCVDEIQLAADPDRGHIFTDRLLHARGFAETMFLGAETIAPLMRRLLPGIEIDSRPRMSKLVYTGAKSLTRLPPRTAIVAFSAADVYAIAEIMRRQRGGAAVVMGALSPRTRNAQVEMYQEGEVDFLVATDAIGMGLNLDVDHVCFAATRKFDGRDLRPLTAQELAQIAGRAGRHLRNGSFGTTAEIGGLSPDLVEAIEDHDFQPLRRLFWRSRELDFRSVEALLRSLDVQPHLDALAPAPPAEDHLALAHMARQPELMARARGYEAVKLLWEVCRVPDFHAAVGAAHVGLLRRLFLHLTQPEREGRLPGAWVGENLARLDRVDGDLDRLTERLARIRTWSYVANRPGWLADPGEFQLQARRIEDRLSDALHDRLTQRFVDRDMARASRQAEAWRAVEPVVAHDGAVELDGREVGRLDGFDFRPSGEAAGLLEIRPVRDRVRKSIRRFLEARFARLAARDDLGPVVALVEEPGDSPAVTVEGAVLGRLGAEPDGRPKVVLSHRDHLPSEATTDLVRRVEAVLAARAAEADEPLLRLEAAALKGAARGIAFRLVEGGGVAPAEAAADLVAGLDADQRQRLARFGVRLGRRWLYLKPLFEPARIRMRRPFLAARYGGSLPEAADGVRTSLTLPDAAGTIRALAAAGYLAAGPRAVRVDMIERLDAGIRAGLREARDGFAVEPGLLAPLGCPQAEAPALLAALGHPVRTAEDGRMTVLPARSDRARKPHRSRKPARPPAAAAPAVDPGNPFAKLGALVQGAGSPAAPARERDGRPSSQGSARIRRGASR
ncbi:helicase-related protein [Tistrella mobilis]|uniref:Helicase-like protein n=1 Tax=Tistrella mobilis (strain KA081020-065) TaxID=1110502 RepID=I3TQ57_TISMK|nr:helicase-related protein [Tistrella mobilis]AFK54895.1 Helicase-like protein [Tistrella mobilis KA081020-065]